MTTVQNVRGSHGALAKRLLYGAVLLWLLPRNAVVLFLRGYQKVVSPLYGDVCRYHPSCSHYSLGSVQYRGVIVGTLLTGWRVLRCNPWAAGGYDYPSPPRNFHYHVTRFGFVVPNPAKH